MEKEPICKDDILAPLVNRTKTLLVENFKIKLVGKEIEIHCPDKLKLLDFTSMIGTGGTLSIIFAVSYDDKILEELVRVFMNGEEILEDEKEELMDSVASEIANTILGNSIHCFPNGGKGVTITPPITIKEAKFISKNHGSKIATGSILTNFGEVSINAIGPRLLFVDKFEFKD